jgi:hypothetical protein
VLPPTTSPAALLIVGVAAAYPLVQTAGTFAVAHFEQIDD